MDPWVIAQIRLAERHGLLSGPDLSPIQVMAGQILDSIAVIDKAKSDDRELRLALLARPELDYKSLFPEELGRLETDDEAEIEDSTDAEGNPIPVKYVFTGDYVPTPEEAERDLAIMMAEAAKGDASFEDISVRSEWL